MFENVFSRTGNHSVHAAAAAARRSIKLPS
ncbi:hypothetical protein D046_0857A, partial [Vibrio parahaemolyticus V-223/04]